MKRYLLKYENLYLQYDPIGGYYLIKKDKIEQFFTKSSLDVYFLTGEPLVIENYDLNLDISEFKLIEFNINENIS